MSEKDDFVVSSHDEFNEKTHITHLSELSDGGSRTTIKSRLRKTIYKKKESFILLDQTMLTNAEWQPGNIRIIGDNLNLNIKYTDIDTTRNKWDAAFSETLTGWYSLTSEQIKLIGQSSKIKARIESTDKKTNFTYEEKWCQDFILHCKQFYNNVVDHEVFLSDLTGKSIKAEKKAETDRVEVRANKLKSLKIQRIIFGITSIVAAIILTPIIMQSRPSDLSGAFLFVLIAASAVSFIPLAISQIRIMFITAEINEECPNCNQKTRRLMRSNRVFYATRSVETIVINRVTSEKESKQVVVSDHEVTDDFTCSNCNHQWSSTYIEKGYA